MIIYKITNNLNGKVYVGQTTRSLKARWDQHCRPSSGSLTAIKSAITKYGKQNFKIQPLEIAETIQQLEELEIYYIKYFNSMAPKGYNILAGGNVSNGITLEVRQKMSKSQTGKKRSAESIRKQAVSRTGQRLSQETRDKISISNKGQVRSPEIRANISKSHMGLISPKKGIPLSDETKAKMSASKKGRPWTKARRQADRGAHGNL